MLVNIIINIISSYCFWFTIIIYNYRTRGINKFIYILVYLRLLFKAAINVSQKPVTIKI